MRHQRVMKKFGRSKEHRKALMQSLVTNLILVESIKTTLPKAKQARKDAEKMVTLARKGGYTRILKLGARKGDAAPMCLLQWVSVPEVTDAAPEAAPAAEAPKAEEAK